MSEKDKLASALTGLSLDQKRKAIELLELKKLKKLENALQSFKPNEGAQASFFKAPQKIRMLCGGNGLGKTTCLVIEILYTHLKCHPHRDTTYTNHSWVIVPGLDKIEDYWREIKKWCPPSQLPTTDKMGTSAIKRLRWRNGNTTTFYSVDQDSAKLEGTNYDMLFIDEPPPRNLYIAAYRGLRNNPNYAIVLALTPISEPWIYTDLYQKGMLKTDPNIAVFTGSTYENKFLDLAYIEDFKSRLTEEEVRTRIYGEFAVLQGRVFKEFQRHTHVIPTQEWPKEWPVWIGIDPHTRKPNTAVFVGVTPEDNCVVIDELVVEGVDEFAKALKQKELDKCYRVISRRIDNSGSGLDWNRDSAVDHFLKAGIRVSPMKNREKSVDDGIHKIKLALKGKPNASGKIIPGLKFFDRCVSTLNDMELYSWAESRHPDRTGVKEAPRKIHDDMIDPLRYVLMSRPIFHCAVEPIYMEGVRPPEKKTEDSPFKTALKHLFKD